MSVKVYVGKSPSGFVSLNGAVISQPLVGVITGSVYGEVEHWIVPVTVQRPSTMSCASGVPSLSAVDTVHCAVNVH